MGFLEQHFNEVKYMHARTSLRNTYAPWLTIRDLKQTRPHARQRRPEVNLHDFKPIGLSPKYVDVLMPSSTTANKVF